MVPQNSPLTMRRSPRGMQTRGLRVWHRASFLGPSHKSSSHPIDSKSEQGRGSAEFLHSSDAYDTRYMCGFIPRARGRIANSSLSRAGYFQPYPKCQPASKSTLSGARPPTNTPRKHHSITAQRGFQSFLNIMNGTNGINGTHSPNGTSYGTNGTNGTNGINGTATQTFVGAIDQGTTSSRFLIFNQRGEVVVTQQSEFTQIYPEPG